MLYFLIENEEFELERMLDDFVSFFIAGFLKYQQKTVF
jgi:hypothetical protein